MTSKEATDFSMSLVKMALKILEDAKPQGRWEKGNHGDYERPDYYFMCSVCKEETDDDTPYCPYCGSRMEA
jgi:hypothetical protein